MSSTLALLRVENTCKRGKNYSLSGKPLTLDQRRWRGSTPLPSLWRLWAEVRPVLPSPLERSAPSLRPGLAACGCGGFAAPQDHARLELRISRCCTNTREKGSAPTSCRQPPVSPNTARDWPVCAGEGTAKEAGAPWELLSEGEAGRWPWDLA